MTHFGISGIRFVTEFIVQRNPILMGSRRIIGNNVDAMIGDSFKASGIQFR